MKLYIYKRPYINQKIRIRASSKDKADIAAKGLGVVYVGEIAG